jgi:hypothetical protein
MPYYTEQFTNSADQVRIFRNGVLKSYATVARESVEQTGHRSRPHKQAVSFWEKSAQSFDPYAYFLESTSKKQYQDRLSERGLQPKGEPDRGHPFELKRHILMGNRRTITNRHIPSGDTTTWENGLAIPYVNVTPALQAVHDGDLLNPASYKETGLDAFAQQAYSRVAPTSVMFDAGLFLGELLEGLPNIPIRAFKDRLEVIRSVGNGYLNAEFGWKPFINDMKNAADALFGATQLLSQQGKRVHRRYGLPPALASETTVSNGYLNAAGGFTRGFATNDKALVQSGSNTEIGLNTQAEVVYTKTRNSTRWFEGEFSSFYPLGFDPDDFNERYNVLVKTDWTPATLWELAPWSWLIDWNLRIGDSIRANELAANDLLVMHYGYAMETTVYSTMASWRITQQAPAQYYEVTGVPHKGFLGSQTQYKRRLRANPYGFRVGGAEALTGNQYAILGALGLTMLK